MHDRRSYRVTIKPPFRIALAAVAAILLALVPSAFAGKPGGGRTCTQNAPSITVENNWAWGSTGSWGMPGQRIAYQIRVTNNDVYCSSSSFAVSLSAPAGFSVSMPTSTISLKSTTQGYLWAYVTSPTGAADGSYPLALSAQRAGTATAVASSSSTTYYKVYSSDTTAPTPFWPDPISGQTITGGSYALSVSANDDHAVKQIDIYIDGTHMSTTLCDDISYNCHAAYSWRTVAGQHTATFTATDWMGNVGSTTSNFTVG
jgi:hypothetical protein